MYQYVDLYCDLSNPLRVDRVHPPALDPFRQWSVPAPSAAATGSGRARP